MGQDNKFPGTDEELFLRLTQLELEGRIPQDENDQLSQSCSHTNEHQKANKHPQR